MTITSPSGWSFDTIAVSGPEGVFSDSQSVTALNQMNYDTLEVNMDGGVIALSGLKLRGDVTLQSGSVTLSALDVNNYTLRVVATRSIEIATIDLFQGRFSVVSENEITIQNDVSFLFLFITIIVEESTYLVFRMDAVRSDWSTRSKDSVAVVAL